MANQKSVSQDDTTTYRLCVVVKDKTTGEKIERLADLQTNIDTARAFVDSLLITGFMTDGVHYKADDIISYTLNLRGKDEETNN